MLGENSPSSTSPALEIISVKSSRTNKTMCCLSVSFSSLLSQCLENPRDTLFLTECVSDDWHLNLVMTTCLQSFTLCSVSMFLKTESLGTCNDKLQFGNIPVLSHCFPCTVKRKQGSCLSDDCTNCCFCHHAFLSFTQVTRSNFCCYSLKYRLRQLLCGPYASTHTNAQWS